MNPQGLSGRLIASCSFKLAANPIIPIQLLAIIAVVVARGNGAVGRLHTVTADGTTAQLRYSLRNLQLFFHRGTQYPKYILASRSATATASMLAGQLARRCKLPPTDGVTHLG